MAGNVTILTRRSSYSISPRPKKADFGGSSFPTHSPNSWTYLWPTHGAKIFENPGLFNPTRTGKNHNADLYLGPSPPISNIFYVLQILAPGMLVIYYEYQLHDADIKVSRLLPRTSWIKKHTKYMMGNTDALITAAARDRKIAFLEERTERPQDNSHHSSLPGTDAVPSSSLPGMDAVPSSSLPGMDALPSTSSLPGTNALPKIKNVFVKEGTSTKDQQKPASQKKKKPRSSRTDFAGSSNSSYTTPRYYITSDGNGLFDKDYGWRGQCTLME